MRKFLFLFLTMLSIGAFAQPPANDDCLNAEVIPFPPNWCSGPIAYTNENATEEMYPIPNQCTPPWNGGQRDVWFTFTTPDPSTLIIDYTITIDGTLGGTILQPQVAIFRGDCSQFAEVSCATSNIGESFLQLTVEDLDPATQYWIRVNDYSVNATPNSGTFQICLEEFVPPPCLPVPGPTLSNECNGTLFDSGCATGNYGPNENATYTICPSTPHNCLFFELLTYDMENNFDVLTFYDGPDTNAPLICSVTGVGSNQIIQATSQCLTIQFQSDGTVEGAGWEANWSCTNAACQNFAPITVDNTVTADDLINTISSSGVLVSNPILNCSSANGIGYGTFSVPDGFLSSFGMQSGIVLTSGQSINAQGPNSAGGTGTSLGNPGDADLDGLSNANTNDACVLEFDVFAVTDMLQFNYVFGSDEYPEFVNSGFNDVFGFFISGPGIVGDQNIALIPGTSTPVAINNVNDQLNTAFYVDNQGSSCNGQSIEYDGHTTVLTAMATVQPCQTYRLKLAVADAGDFIFDSGVFIEAQSLNVGVASISPSYEFSPDLEAAIEGCAEGTLTVQLDMPNMDTTFVAIEYSGTAINGIDYPLLPDTVAIPPGATTIFLDINPLSDGIVEGVETAIISLQTETLCGVINYDSAVINIQDDIILTTQDTISICIGESALLTADGAISYSWSPAATLDNQMSQNPTATPTVSTTYFVTGSASGVTGACGVTDSTYVEVINPLITISNPDTVFICEGQSIQLTSIGTGGGNNIIWSPPFGLDDSQSFTPTASPAVTTTYQATYGIQGCASFDQVTVVVQPAPQLNVVADSIICDGQSLILSANGNPGASYTWSPVDGLDDPFAENPTASPSVTTTYSVTATIGPNCTTTASTTITVVTPPTISAGDSTALCLGDSVLLTGTTSLTGTFEWSPAIGLSDPNSASTMASPPVSTDYVFTVDVSGCFTRDTVRVEVFELDALNVIPDTFMCEGDTLLLSSNTGPGTYTWGPADGLSSPTAQNPLASPTTTTTYTVFAENGACFDTAALDIIVFPIPELDIVVPDQMAVDTITVCNEDSLVTLQALTPLGGNFMWEPFDLFVEGGASNPFSDQPTITLTQDTTVTVSYTGNGGCMNFDTVRIELGVPTAVMVNNDTTICQGESVLLSGMTAIDGVTYEWSPSDGIADPSSPNVTVTPTQTTTYTLVGSTEKCADSMSITVVVIPPITVDLADQEVCQGESITLNPIINVPGGTYSWSPTTGLDDPNILNPTVTPTADISYTLTVDIEGCIGSGSIDIVVSEPLNLNVNPEETLCPGESYTLANSPTVAGAIYTWQPTDGLDDPNSPNPVATPSDTTTYTLVASNGACLETASVTVNVIDDLTVDAGDDQILCEGDAITLIANGANGDTFSWSPVDGLDDPTSPTPIATPGSTTVYTVTYSLEDCSVTDEVTVTVGGDFNLNVTNDTSIIQGDAIQLSADVVPTGGNGTGQISYSWTDPTDLDLPNTANPTASPLQTTTYNVVATSEFGCTATGSVNINVIIANFGTPNAFTPNGDGLNDFFIVETEGNVILETFDIYNRWGEKVYANQNLLGWDGRFNGEDQPMEVYIYYAVLRLPDGSLQEVKGDVTLIR
ncbi:MAG: choice-of-anchor L domain-containing protein [Bacteroidota bacterium]